MFVTYFAKLPPRKVKEIFISQQVFIMIIAISQMDKNTYMLHIYICKIYEWIKIYLHYIFNSFTF